TQGRIDAGTWIGSPAVGDVTLTAVTGGVLIENAVTASHDGRITVGAKQDIRTRRDVPTGIDSPLKADRDVTLTSSNGTITKEAFVQAGNSFSFGSISASAPLGSVIETGG